MQHWINVRHSIIVVNYYEIGFLKFIKISKYELSLDSDSPQEEAMCKYILDEFTTSCGRDVRKMTAEEIIKCQKTCPYDDFYRTK